MNRKQRKLHLISWIALALLIPSGFVAALLVIPEKALQENLFIQQTEKYQKVLAKQSNEHFISLLRSNNQNNQLQLEVIVTKPFKNPEIGVYLSVDGAIDPSINTLLGNLKGNRTNIFELPKTILTQSDLQIVFYDPIHQQKLSHLKFEL